MDQRLMDEYKRCENKPVTLVAVICPREDMTIDVENLEYQPRAPFTEVIYQGCVST